MTRYLALSFIIILVAAGCGQSESLSGTGTPESAGVESTRESTPGATFTPTEPEPTATSTSTSTPTVTPTPTSDGYEIITIPPNGTKTETGPRPSVPDIEAPANVTEPVIPTATPTPDVDPLVELPPVPEVTSCRHAADLTLERLQIFLDVLAPYPEEVFTGSGYDSELDATLTHVGEQVDLIDQRAQAIGCSEDDLLLWIGQGIQDLHAEGEAAEWFLEAIIYQFEEQQTEEPLLPTVTPTWEIATCDDGVTEFIAITQVLFDYVAGMTVEEFDALDESPEEFLIFASELLLLVDEFHALGCSDADVDARILARIDELEANGEVPELLLADLLEDLEAGEFLSGIEGP